MGALREILVGWISGNIFRVESRIDVLEEVSTTELSPSEMGFKFQADELSWLMDNLKGFETVEFLDPRGGGVLDPNHKGADGGIDCIIRITATTERAAHQVAGKIRQRIIRHARGEI